MSGRDELDATSTGTARLAPPTSPATATGPATALVFGELVALVEDGRSGLVTYEGMPGAHALQARSLVDLDATSLGRTVGLLFENGDPARPVVAGFLAGQPGLGIRELPGTLEGDVHGQRMLLTAQRQLVLRCGKASITLHETGEVEIRGEHILTHAKGANRVRGGSVELN